MAASDLIGVSVPLGVSLVFANERGYYYVSVEPSVMTSASPPAKIADLYLRPALTHLRQQTERLRDVK